MPTDQSYKGYLKSLSKQKIPNEIIKTIVKEGTGMNMLSKRKIIAGEVNDVYEIILEDNSCAILRISPHGSPDFKQEQWAIKECQRVGIQAPEILLIKYVTVNGEKKGFCLMRKIDGETLARENINFDKLSINEQKMYIYQAGQILSKIHSISTAGFGRINKNGKAQFKTPNDLITNLSENESVYKSLVDKAKLDISIVETAMKLLSNLNMGYSRIKPNLNHGDYFRKHLVVKNKKIVGVLDWAEIRSDFPAYDFANWDFWVGDPVMTNWLKAGYMNQDIFNGDFEIIFHSLKILIGLEALEWYCLQSYPKMVDELREKLIIAVNYFS